MIFCTKLHLDESKKFLFAPQGFLTPKPSFLAENGLFETAHKVLMIFSQMLDIIALNDLVSVLCASVLCGFFIILRVYILWFGMFLREKNWT